MTEQHLAELVKAAERVEAAGQKVCAAMADSEVLGIPPALREALLAERGAALDYLTEKRG